MWNIYYSTERMTNILLQGILSESFWVFMDLSIDNSFYTFDKKGKYIKFYQCPTTKLYQLDVSMSKGIVILLPIPITTVYSQKIFFLNWILLVQSLYTILNIYWLSHLIMI